jgi:hypothetical protein
VTVTSDLAASGGFNINRMNTPVNSPTNPTRTGALMIIFMMSGGPGCESPYNFTNDGILRSKIEPGSFGEFIAWLSNPNVLSPSFSAFEWREKASILRGLSWSYDLFEPRAIVAHRIIERVRG